MKFKLHNKLEIFVNEKTYSYYNNIFENVYKSIANFEPYFSHIAIGTGTANFEDNASFKLGNFVKCLKLETENLQHDISKGVLFSKKVCIIDSFELDNKYITEIGITSQTNNNPEIFNYFSLISEENPNGILKINGESIILSVSIFLEFDNTENLTLGNNPLVSLILGEGSASKEVFAICGSNLSTTENIYRPMPNQSKTKANITYTFENGLFLDFSFNINSKEVYEVVLTLDNKVFFRKCVIFEQEPQSETLTLTPKEHYILNLGENAYEVSNVLNISSSTTESNFGIKKYACEFGDKIETPFHNLFSFETPRFLSKDGKRIIFLLDDKIFVYENSNYEIYELNTFNLNISNIQKIVAFEDFVFVLSKNQPYFFAYKITRNECTKLEIDFSNYSLSQNLNSIYDFDASLAKDGTLMLGIIFSETYIGSALYLSFNSESSCFQFEHENNFNKYPLMTIMAMHRNNFSDALLIFLKHGVYSSECKIITNYPDKTYTDYYTILGYYYTSGTKSVYTKDRAVVVEKAEEPKLWIYLYPQMYRYNLPLISDELDNYLSTNLLYLIQKYSNSDYKIYSLVEYKNPQEFKNGFPSTLDKSKIADFEFLDDTLLIFMKDNNEKIIAYNLKNTNMIVENVSSDVDTYEVNVKKYNLLGKNNEGVIVNFSINIHIWFFQKIFINLHQETTPASLQKAKIIMIFLLKMLVFKNII